MKTITFFLLLFLGLSQSSNAQNTGTKIINQNIILEDSIIGVTDSLVFTSTNEGLLYVTLFEKIPSARLKKLKSNYEDLYSCSLNGKINYKIQLQNHVDITPTNSEYFKQSGEYLEQAARISNSSILILAFGFTAGGAMTLVNPGAGALIILASGVVSLVQGIRTNKYLRLAGKEIAKAK